MAGLDQAPPGAAPLHWDPLIPLDDPYPVYRRLPDARPPGEDWQPFSSASGGQGNDVDDGYQLFEPAGDLAATDPPLHTRLRSALRMAFSPSALRRRFEPAGRAKTTGLVDAFPESGGADFAWDFARPLPA